MKKNLLIFSILLVGSYLSLPALEGSSREIVVGEQMLRLLKEFFPPDYSILPDIFEGLKETFQIAFWSTLFAVIISIPLSVLASQRISGSLTSNIFLILF